MQDLIFVAVVCFTDALLLKLSKQYVVRHCDSFVIAAAVDMMSVWSFIAGMFAALAYYNHGGVTP